MTDITNHSVFSGLDGLELTPTRLEREWVIIIDTPVAGVEQVTNALSAQIPLVQGPYGGCLFVREAGYQQFRALAGSHAGDEGTVQRTQASQIELSIPPDHALLERVLDVVFASHVNEEPTIRVTEAIASRSNLLDDRENPNRYWNRPDAAEIHGDVITS